ncbi:beta-aspartyl-peptidase [Oceanirhabdus sp. W0125-5]|uniref:beta-aspartyl-peptidase n=1 Tax=Oceanirhabdus sp. W0125-5 TaxID=2999116 RepID=UPI0022F2B4A0|nr:beta-aspartyl-peptidase [Oceanirhabdus sp. W0125-5]WBW98754.1 beta-aspartyl-peptidase [Oceanirhabdus sp. W0125-5]
MIKVIKNIHVYAPDDIGVKDIVLCGENVIAIEENFTCDTVKCEIIDGTNKIAVPGIIDSHVHIIGGGGEGGFHTRTPEVNIIDVVKAGVTSVVGLLGTDGITRTVEDLLAKAYALEHEGISTFILTGSYEVPTKTLTGDIKKDIAFIPKVRGVKIALSDHRSSHPTKEEILRITSDVRVASMLSGKQGTVHIHMGSEAKCLKDVFKIIEETDIPANIFYPTHINRNQSVLNEGIKLTQLGGRIDISAHEEDTKGSAKDIVTAIELGAVEEQITLSSDGNGSIPKFDDNGKMIGIGIGRLDAVIETVKSLIEDEHMDIGRAFKFVTENAAKGLGIFPQKGSITEGCDADILILDHDLNVDGLIAKGKMLMKDKEIHVKSTFKYGK